VTELFSLGHTFSRMRDQFRYDLLLTAFEPLNVLRWSNFLQEKEILLERGLQCNKSSFLN